MNKKGKRNHIINIFTSVLTLTFFRSKKIYLTTAENKIVITTTVTTGALENFHNILYRLTIPEGGLSHVPEADDSSNLLRKTNMFGRYARNKIPNEYSKYFQYLFLKSFINNILTNWMKTTKNPK